MRNRFNILSAAISSVVGFAAATSIVSAATLYSNVVPMPNPDIATHPNEPFVGDGGPATEARLDDVQVNNILNPLMQPLAITEVTFGILRDPGAPPVTISGYYGTIHSPPNPVDFPILNTPIPASFGSVSLGTFNGATQTVVPVTIGDGITPLFIVTPNFTDNPGYSEFAVGLQFSDGDVRNNWTLAQYTPGVSELNFDGAYLYNFTTQTAQGYALGTTQRPLQTTFSLDIQGNPIPEPTTMALMGIAIIGGLTAQRRR